MRTSLGGRLVIASLTSTAVLLGSTGSRLARLWEPLEVTVDIGGDSFRIV